MRPPAGGSGHTGQSRRPLTAAGLAMLALAALGAAACTSDGGSETEFCERVATVPALDSLLTGFGNADPGELATRLDTASAAYGDLRDAAPGDIRGPVGTVVDLVDAVLDDVEARAEDPEALADALRATVAEHPDAEQAATEVAAYARDRCDVDLNPTIAGDPTGGTTTEPAAPDGGG